MTVAAAGRGRFITFEGGEGTGKSTQCRRLAAWLQGRGITVLATREPGGTPAAETIRALLLDGDADQLDAMSEALLHFAARREHVRCVIAPALAAGTWVLCDRFSDSTMAYQGLAMGLGRPVIECLHRLAVGALMPDLTLVLDLAVAESLPRARRQGGADRYESREVAFHEALRRAFQNIAAREPGRCVVIDAGGDEETVAAAIRGCVQDD
jgi:dTMP kinase